MKLDAFDYSLVAEKIATKPANPRESARLLDLSGEGLTDRLVADLPQLLGAGDVLIVNNTQVIPARLEGRRGEAKISVTLHKRLSEYSWRVFAKPAKKCRINDVLSSPRILQLLCAAAAMAVMSSLILFIQHV